MGAMSQVLGKPQPEEEEDDDEEEDELVGLADYGDGPDSSDAEPDSGAEEGGERRVHGSAPRPGDLGRHPRRAGRAGRGLGGDPGERSFGVGVGRGAGGAVASCKMGEPRCRQRRGDRDRWRGQRGGVLTGGTRALGQFGAFRRVWGLGRGGTARRARDLSLNAAVEARVRCRG